MKNYKYTENWFDYSGFDQLPFFNTKEEIHILEIGSFEGKSAVWFLENYLQNPKSTITCIDPWTNYSQDDNSFNSYNSNNAEWDFTNHKKTFLHNIFESGCFDQVNINHGFSHEILPQLINAKKQYDFIFIDGNHTAPFVLTDAIMSWYLLKVNGVMSFDDYLWSYQTGDTITPKLAVDSFVSNFNDYIQVIDNSIRKTIKRIK